MRTDLVRNVLTGLSLRRLVMIAVLTAAWCVLWGAVSPANLLSGGLLALIVTAPGLGGALGGGVSLVPLLQLMWLIFVDLVKSTILVSREILTPNDHTSESILAVTVPLDARRHMLLYTAAITLTPGTVVVDTDVEAGILYVHLLQDVDLAANDAHVQRMATLAAKAFPPRGGRTGRIRGDRE